MSIIDAFELENLLASYGTYRAKALAYESAIEEWRNELKYFLKADGLTEKEEELLYEWRQKLLEKINDEMLSWLDRDE